MSQVMASNQSIDSIEHGQQKSFEEQFKDLRNAGSITSPGFGAEIRIFDIRQGREDISLAKDIHRGLHVEAGREKTLPTMLLYDENGLQLFEEITYLKEYYLTNAEIDLLVCHAEAIADTIKPGSMLLELGSGNLRKTDILLRAMDRLEKPVEYYALDLSYVELVRTLSAIPPNAYKHVECFGLLGTYDDGLSWLQSPSPHTSDRTKVIMSMGSSIGNFPRNEATEFIAGFAEAIGQDDVMLIGIDGCKDADRVYQAYNDARGLTHRFTLNGLSHANRVLHQEAFNIDDWQAHGVYDAAAGRHQAFVYPSQDVQVCGVDIKAGEKIRIEESYKYERQDINQLWRGSGVRKIAEWPNAKGDYTFQMVAKKNLALPLSPEEYAAGPIPTWAEWQHLWVLWDIVTRQMIPNDGLLDKPIKLRNACMFYLGHIPTFLDMKLTDNTDGIYTEPSYYPKIFERGIDPDVDNPEQCHDHSEIPDAWPPLDEILLYQRRVRERVKVIYDSKQALQPLIGRCLWLGYEHESMHLETLLYMLVQSDKTLPPSSTPQPNFDLEANWARTAAVTNEWIKVAPRVVVINMDDPETESGPARYFGWDCEKPSRKADVKSFEAKARPITNGEYATYLESCGRDVPVSWASTESSADGVRDKSQPTSVHGVPKYKSASPEFLSNKVVRTVYGSVPLSQALDWPVSASYDEVAGCANFMGGRIPTLEEARSIYAQVNERDFNQLKAHQALGQTIPAVNSHLVNNGVPESPPYLHKLPAADTGDPDGAHGVGSNANVNPRDMFVDLRDCNVGFQQWFPAPVTQNGSRLSGQGDMGGLWEWTSTPLAKHEGFEPMRLYEAYSQDFMDGKHNIVLGGSWATVPRIAGRKSFINWYQRNYPYVWAGARLVRDI